ncbi:MAG TPA: FeoA family protein [Nocardioides sp.]|nr:FeoA family protein [Nocardioides sp.]
MPGATRSLVELPAGARATVVGLAADAEPHIARRLVDLGLVPGTEVTVVRRAPLRDPTLYRFADTSMCLRAAQARWVEVRASVSTAVGPSVSVA